MSNEQNPMPQQGYDAGSIQVLEARGCSRSKKY